MSDVIIHELPQGKGVFRIFEKFQSMHFVWTDANDHQWSIAPHNGELSAMDNGGYMTEVPGRVAEIYWRFWENR